MTNRKFENHPIAYARFKHTSTSKIVSERGRWENKKKLISKGFDSLLHRWDIVNTEYIFEDMSKIGCFKELIQNIYVKRSAIGADMKETSKWFLIKRKITVLDKDNNIFLTQADGRTYQSDLTTTASVNLNHIPEGMKITKVSEKPLTQKELLNLERILNDEKVYIKPLCCSELQNGELRLEV
jgi:hypothetical protein